MSFVLLGILNSQAAGGVLASDYSLLETVDVTIDTASVGFSSMVSTYASEFNNLFVIYTLRNSSGGQNLEARLNNNSVNGRNYWALSTQQDSTINTPTRDSGNRLRVQQELGSATNEFSSGIINLEHFANHSDASFVCFSGLAGGSGNRNLSQSMGYVRFEGSVDQIDLFPASGNFKAGSRVSLYGAV